MKKYSKEMVYNYIMGNDIDNYSIDDLESDSKFMLKAIKMSKDKRLYNFCSDDVKHDFSFSKELITSFSDDIDFIIEVASEYIKGCKDPIDDTEINILISNYYKDDCEDRFIPFMAFVNSLFFIKSMEYEKTIMNVDLEWKDKLGCGFPFVLCEYENRPIIKDFFAKKMSEKLILKNNNVSLEFYLHKRFNNPQDILQFGIKRLLINYIYKFDSELAQYIEVNNNLLCNVEKEILYIIKNWDKWEQYNILELKEEILDQIDDYVTEKGNECKFLETELIYYIARKMNYKFLLDDIIYSESDFLMSEKIYKFTLQNSSFQDRLVLKELENRIKLIANQKNGKKDLINTKTKVYDFIKLRSKYKETN